MPLIILGAGSLGHELAAWVLEEAEVKGSEIVFADRDPVGDQRHFDALEGGEVLVAIADPLSRLAETNRLGSHFNFPTFIHRSFLNAGATLAEGSMFFPYSIASTGGKFGKGLIVNTHCSIGHDVTIGEYCTLASGVRLCGGVTVGNCVEFGTGTVVLPGRTIGAGARIGAGAVVVNDVPPGTTVFGNPARIVKPGSPA